MQRHSYSSSQLLWEVRRRRLNKKDIFSGSAFYGYISPKGSFDGVIPGCSGLGPGNGLDPGKARLGLELENGLLLLLEEKSAKADDGVGVRDRGGFWLEAGKIGDMPGKDGVEGEMP